MIKPFDFNREFGIIWQNNSCWMDAVLMALFIPSYQINDSYFEVNVINAKLDSSVIANKMKKGCSKFNIMQAHTDIKMLYDNIKNKEINPLIYDKYKSISIIQSMASCVNEVELGRWNNLTTTFKYFADVYNFQYFVCELTFNVLTEKYETSLGKTYEIFGRISKIIYYQIRTDKKGEIQKTLEKNMVCIKVKCDEQLDMTKKYNEQLNPFDKIITFSTDPSMIINNVKYNLVSIAYGIEGHKLSAFKDLTNNMWYTYDSSGRQIKRWKSFMECFNSIKLNFFDAKEGGFIRDSCFMVFHNVGPIINNQEITPLLIDLDTLYNRKYNIQQLLNLINH